jgi:hypothetical protein
VTVDEIVTPLPAERLDSRTLAASIREDLHRAILFSLSGEVAPA